jgi:hypothetical protein
MGVTVYQGGKQGSLIMVPGRSLRPLAAEEGKGSHVEDRAFANHHCAIFDGWLGYGNDQAGPVENRTGITPRWRHGAAGTGRIEVYLFSGHTSLSLVSISAARLLLFPAGSCQHPAGRKKISCIQNLLLHAVGCKLAPISMLYALQ